MRVADAAQFFEIALRRHQNAGRPRDGLHDDGGDGRRIVQRDDAFQIVCQMRPPVRLATRKGHFRQIMGVGQMIDAGQQIAEMLAVVGNAANRRAADTDPVIAAFAPDQPRPACIAAELVIGQRHF